MSESFSVVWLKRDLRVEDHLAFFEARKRGRVIALYVFEPQYWSLPDTSLRQQNFICESILELQPQLARLGIPLLIYEGAIERAITRLVQKIRVFAIHAHQETGNVWTFERDIRVRADLSRRSIPLVEHMQHGVFRALDTRNGWASRWDRMMFEAAPPLPARQDYPSTVVESLAADGFRADILLTKNADNNCSQRQKGGRQEGLSLLASFLNGRGENYRKAMSSPLEGADACSRISAHLAYGTLSIRECFQAAIATMGKLDTENPSNKKMKQSLVSFIGRLHWHCHFIQKLETTPAIEWSELHPAYRGIRTETDQELLERWFQGQTGWPFLDACMRSLHATGWLNFRMRAMVMAVASYHFWQPWQEAGMRLGSLFTDYEPGIHWPQVQMQSGTTGINTIRIYNPIKQGYDQDPNGVFIKRWIPELEDAKGRELHEPWRGASPPANYPSILLDHQQSARDARDRIWAVRKERGFGKDARKVLEKHSSRKSVKQADHNRRNSKRTDKNQLGFDF